MPQDVPLNAVRVFGADSVYAVGTSGTILHSAGGEHWAHQSSETQASLNAIFGTPDGKKLWVVGGTGTILHSTDGEHWTAQSSKVSYSLHSIFGTQDGSQLWAVGDFGTVLHSTDGKHWAVQSSGTKAFLFSVYGTLDGKLLWAVGDAGTILHTADGEHWAVQSSGTKASLLSVCGTLDGKLLWAVGDAGTILHSTDGKHWAAQPMHVRSYLRSISATPDGKQLWAVGGFVVPGGKRHDTILHSTDGKHWTVQYSEESAGALNSVFSAPDSKQVWAVGTRAVLSTANQALPPVPPIGNPAPYPEYRGTMLHSTDGDHWVAQPHNILHSLFGTPDGRQLWAAGERVAPDGKRRGTILHSTDGENWEAQYSETTDTTSTFWSIFGTADGKQLWAVGCSGCWTTPGEPRGIILHSTDGNRWTAQSSGTDAVLVSIFGTADGKQLWAVGSIGSTAAGTILHSADGDHWATLNLPTRRMRDFGPTQFPAPAPYLLSIFGTPDGRHLWAVGGDGTILHSTDGQHWSFQRSDERPSSQSVHDLNSVFGTSDGKRLWAVGGQVAIGDYLGRPCEILYSTDGEQWAAQSCGVNTPLLCVWGTPDGRKLWAVGEDGTILHSTDGEHWANHRTVYTSAFRNMATENPLDTFASSNLKTGYENYSFQSIFGTADGKRLWLTGTGASPQQPPMQEQGAPTIGILLKGETPVHASYVESARLENTLTGARLDLKLHVPSGFENSVFPNFQVRNDFDFENNRPAPKLAARRPPQVKASRSEWSFEFDPGKAAVGSGQLAHFDITLDDGLLEQHFDYTATYDPLRFFRDNAKWIVLLATVLLILGCFTLLLFVKPLWNLYLHRLFKLNKIGDISIPGIGDLLKAVLRTLAVLPWYVKRPRTLDAWIQHNREALATAWSNDAPQTPSKEGRNPEFYVQLPVVIGNPVAGSLLQQPTPEDFTRLMGESRYHLQIVGPGGAGKTTLARQIGRWVLDGYIRGGNDGHKMIPIWIDEDLSETNSVSKVIRDKLYASLLNEDLENDFCDVLLRKQRLLVIVDRLSERSPETQSYMRKLYRTTRLGALIVTSRTSLPVDGPVPTLLFPQPLNSASMLFFMTSLLATFAVNKNESGSGEVGPLGTMTEQLKLGQLLASLIQLRTPDGKQEIPMLPLQVRLFVEQAIDFLSIGKSLDDLPTSLPDVYVQYLKQVNPKTSASNSLSDDEMLRVAKTLGKLALQPNYMPKEFSPEAARDALQSNGWASFDPIDPIERLKSNGVLFHREIGPYTRLRFALDPIAEFLGAFAYAEECGANQDSWNRILESSEAAPGFQIALKLIHQAYGSDLGWPLDQRAKDDVAF